VVLRRFEKLLAKQLVDDMKFNRMRTAKDRIQTTIQNLRHLFSDSAALGQIAETAEFIITAIKSGNKLLICGNGGSAADAQHVAGEFMCRFYRNREPLPAIAISTDTSVITSISNDYSYNDIFSRQIKALGKKDDVLLGISTSGSSGNVLQAFKTARAMEIKTVLLTGHAERDIAAYSDVIVKTPSVDTPRIQEMHLLIEHVICEIIENELYG
jgi:D-sedoheptulose 7-phosphate isomerase